MKTSQKPKFWIAVFAMVACLAYSAVAQSSKPASQNYPAATSDKVETSATATSSNAAPVKTEAPKAAPAPAKTEAPAPKAQPAKATAAPAASAVNTEGKNCYTLEKSMVTTTEVGENIQYRLRITSNSDFNQVSVQEQLPDNATYISAEPNASVAGKTLSWNVGPMNKGDYRDFIITVRPEVEGNYATISKVITEKTVEMGFFAGMPKLEIRAVAKATSTELEDTASYTVTVKNVGTAVARDVVITNSLPEALVAISGKESTWQIPVGNLAPNAEKSYVIDAKAVRRGLANPEATAVAANVKNPVKDIAKFNIIESKLSIAKSGTERQFIFRDADYVITVKNEGDTVLKNVNVTDEAVSGSKIVTAAGAEISKMKDKATWTIPTLAAGEVKTFNVTVLNERPGVLTSKAVAKSDNGKSATAEATTMWQGAPGLVYEISDEKDPVLVGETNIYTVTLKNQGQFETIVADVKVTFAANVVVLDDKGNANGQVVEFKQVSVKPKETVTYKINTKALTGGVSKATLEVKSNYMTQSFSKEEPTYIY